MILSTSLLYELGVSCPPEASLIYILFIVFGLNTLVSNYFRLDDEPPLLLGLKITGEVRVIAEHN